MHLPVRITSLFFILIGIFSGLYSQEVIIDYVTIKNRDLFGISFEKDKKEFFGRVTNLQGLYLQEYQTETFLVTELNLDMTGSNQQVRIYAIQTIASADSTQSSQINVPKSVKDLPNAYRDRLKNSSPGQKIESLVPTNVFKNYPVVTHAKTIEYLLDSRTVVYDLYTSIKEVWVSPIISEEASNEEKRTSTRRGLNRCLFILEE